jgi:PAS domain S-box-containing protein
MDTVMSPGAGGILMRRLAPPMIVLLLVFAWLRVLGEEKGLYDEQYGITLMILIATLTLGLAIYLSARHLTRVDQERMRMKKAAEDNAAEMLDLFNNAPCGYHSTDVDGVITRINDTELAWLGYRREEVVGRMKFSALLDQASRDDFGAVFNALKVRGAIEGFELVLKRADGSPLAALVNSQAVRDGLGSFMGSRDTVFDITSKKQTDRALRESNSQMRATLEKLQGVQSKMTEQARMRALGEMSSGIAHEINNTIAPILGFSETMLEWPETLDNREQTVEFLRIIHKAAADAAAVVSRLRKFHRRGEDTAKMRGRNVNEMVTDAIILTQPIWKNRAQVEGKTIQVTSNIMETRPLVCNDDEIREALVNLIMNSISAINRKGTITIAAEGTRDETVIRVNDDGAGMPENVRKHALEPFFTTKGTKGTGLGLSMVAGTVERHNGIIRIESTPGRGTAVTMRFRRRKEKAEDGPTNTPSLRWKDSLKILAVDDEPSIRRLLVEYLKKDGHHPEPAATGKEALDKFRKSNYDLVITDRAMPEMNGDELAKKIKKASPRTPIIMITGVHVSEKTHADLPAGVDRILGKPFSIKELRMAISSVMGPLPRESRARKANRKHKK